MRFRLAAVVALALLAGCGSVVGLGGQSTETVTPAPVPTNSPTPEDPRVGLAPGLDAEGIFDLDYLLQHHVEALADESYVWEERERNTYLSQNESLTESGSQTILVEDEYTYLRNVSSLQRYQRGARQFLNEYESYADGDAQYTKYFSYGEVNVTYERTPSPPSADQFAQFAHSRFRSFLPTENVTVARLDGGDQQRYEIRGTRDTVPGYRGSENVTTRAVIRENGLIEHVETTLVVDPEINPIRIHYETNYTTTDDVTVDPPTWFDDARTTLEE